MATSDHTSSSASSAGGGSNLVSSRLERRRAKRTRQQSSAFVPYARSSRSAFVRDEQSRSSSPEIPVFAANGLPAKDPRDTTVLYAGTRIHNVDTPHHIICKLAAGVGRFVLFPLSRDMRKACEAAWGPLPAKAMIGGCNGYALVVYDCPLYGRVVHELCFIMGTRVWRQCSVIPTKFFGSPWTPFSDASFHALLEPDTCYVDEPEPDPVELGLVRMLSAHFGA